MGATAKGGGNLYWEGRQALRSFCPQAVLNWREARFYARYGEVELHLLDLLCRRDPDAIDIGANDGCYVHHLRLHARRVVAFEPMPGFADMLRRKFRRDVVVESVALSDTAGTATLRTPIVDGVVVTGCSTVSPRGVRDLSRLSRRRGADGAAATASMPGDAAIIKIDVEGHELAVLGRCGRDGPALPAARAGRAARAPVAGRRGARQGLFQGLGYCGYFVHHGELKPIDRFSVAEMQNPCDLPDLTATLKERERFGRFIYNFIFLPPGEPAETLRRLSDRLSRL